MISYIRDHKIGGRQTFAGQEFKHLVSTSQCKDLQPTVHTNALTPGWLILPADYTRMQGCFQCRQQQQQEAKPPLAATMHLESASRNKGWLLSEPQRMPHLKLTSAKQAELAA